MIKQKTLAPALFGMVVLLPLHSFTYAFLAPADIVLSHRAPMSSARLVERTQAGQQNPPAKDQAEEQTNQHPPAHEKVPSEAEQLYEQALKDDPNNVEALQGLVDLDMAEKQLDKALDRVNAQIATTPKNADFYMIQARLLISKKDLEKAQGAIVKAISLDDKTAGAYLLLGQVQQARGELDKSRASFERSIQQNPQDVRSYILLGSLEERRANWEKAEEWYRKGLEIQPGFALLANNLAYLMLEHGGDLDKAFALAKEARAGFPNLPAAADTLGWAYYRKGNYGPAVSLFQEAIEKEPKNTTYHYHLGLVYQKMNDRAHAREQLERVLELDPNFPQAGEVRKTLAELGKS